MIQGNYGNGVHLNTVESVYPRFCTTLSDTVGISQQLRKGSGGVYDETCFANNKHKLSVLGWVLLCQEGSRGPKCPAMSP